MKVLQEPQELKFSSLIDQSDAISRRENSLDVAYELVDMMRVFYPLTEKPLAEKHKQFSFNQTSGSVENLRKLGDFINDVINEEAEKFWGVDEKLTMLVNQYLKYGAGLNVTLESYSEDITELTEMASSSPELKYALDSFCNLLRYSFSVDKDVYTFETKEENGVGELYLQRSSSIIYINKLSNKLMFANKLDDDFLVYDKDSNIHQLLQLAYNSNQVFNTTNRSYLIVNKAFDKHKLFEVYKKSNGDFVITKKTDI